MTKPSRQQTSANVVDNSSVNIYRKIEESFYSVIRASPSFSNLARIQIGCEHEFIITDQRGTACTLPESQYFLKKLSELSKWKIFRHPNETNAAIIRVSIDLDSGGYHSVKYEHPPHLLELALAPTHSLIDFRERIFPIWEDLLKAADTAGLRLLSVPRISPPKMDWDLLSTVDKKIFALKQSREFLVPKEDAEKPWVNFTTYTAATQFHVGGCNWWKDSPELVEKLYRIEIVTGKCAYEKLTPSTNQAKQLFRKRWEGYSKVFKSSSLVGFPKFDNWNIKHWIEAIASSSLVYDRSNPLAQKNLYSILQEDIEKNIEPVLPFVRDLQIIKPKLIGTLEFRGDPALPGPQAITNQAAIRLGAYLLCLKKQYTPFLEHTYRSLCDRWWDSINHDGIHNEVENTKDSIWQTLRERGLGEEGLL
jgi:hypothetical protein